MLNFTYGLLTANVFVAYNGVRAVYSKNDENPWTIANESSVKTRKTVLSNLGEKYTTIECRERKTTAVVDILS